MNFRLFLSQTKSYVRRLPPEPLYIAFMFLATRVLLTLIGFAARSTITPFPQSGGPFFQNPLLAMWGQWDTRWYLIIATTGYSTSPEGPFGQASYAFFPLYPLLMRLVGGLTGGAYLAGLVVSNISLLASSLLLFKLLQETDSSETAFRTVRYLFLFPTAFLFSAVLSESLFSALALACFYYARKERWALVGTLGLCCSLTRSVGVLIILPLFYEYLTRVKWQFRSIGWPVLYLFLILLGFTGFMGYNYYLTGDALGFVHAQAAWGKQISNPIGVLAYGISPLRGRIQLVVATLLTVCALVLLGGSYRRIQFAHWLFGMCLLLAPLFTGPTSLPSMPRFMVVAFPLYIALAKLGDATNRAADDVLTISCALLQGFLMVLWSLGSIIVT